MVGAYADDGDDSTNLDHHEVDSSFEADWLQDSHGDETIDRQEFVDSVFQLADLWSVLAASLSETTLTPTHAAPGVFSAVAPAGATAWSRPSTRNF